MLIIAVIVSVTIGITKAKLNNIVSYTYYSAFSSIRKVTSSMLSDYDSTKSDYTDVAYINSSSSFINLLDNYSFFFHY